MTPLPDTTPVAISRPRIRERRSRRRLCFSPNQTFFMSTTVPNHHGREETQCYSCIRFYEVCIIPECAHTRAQVLSLPPSVLNSVVDVGQYTSAALPTDRHNSHLYIGVHEWYRFGIQGIRQCCCWGDKEAQPMPFVTFSID